MASIWSGFGSLGLGNLDNVELFEDKKEKEQQANAQPPKEEDFLLEKEVKCPVCEGMTSQKIMKTGKAKLISTDQDLRPKYAHIDSTKYEVYQCDCCGYAALAKDFPHLSEKQGRMIQEGISSRVVIKPSEGTTYSYEMAVERYKLALACAVVKKAKASEKAYICLKSAWLFRGFAESKEEAGETDVAKELKQAEQEYLTKAYQGFSKAVVDERFPLCGMDELTMDYLLSALAFETGQLDSASRLIYKILQNPNASARVKDKASFLKDDILAEVKRKKAELKKEN